MIALCGRAGAILLAVIVIPAGAQSSGNIPVEGRVQISPVKVDPPKIDPLQVKPEPIEPVKVDPYPLTPVDVKPFVMNWDQIQSVTIAPVKVEPVEVAPMDSLKVETGTSSVNTVDKPKSY